MTLEQKIESMRETLYLLYEQNANYDEILKTSTDLDQLLNQLRGQYAND